MNARSVPTQAALLGLASGGRSTAGIAAVVLTSRTDDLPGRLASPWGRRLIPAAALGELVADKLPGVPSRLSPPGLAARVVAGAVAGAALAWRAERSPLAPAIVAAGFAVVGSVAGAFWRS